jgi:hypothetical protein
MVKLLRHIGLLLVLVLPGCSQAPPKGEILASKEKSNGKFTVRVTSFRETSKFAQILAGAYYVFESKSAETDGWRQIMTVPDDDPIPIPRTIISPKY